MITYTLLVYKTSQLKFNHPCDNMFLSLLYFILIISQVACQASVPLHAIDCGQAKTVHNFDAQELCRSAFEDKQKSETLLVAQVAESSIHNGLRCRMTTSVFDVICGFLSHEKLLTIPEISKADPIDSSACEDLFKYDTTARVDGLAIFVEHGKERQYRYVKAGHIRHTENNMYCRGGTIQIDGENVSSVVEMVTRTLLTEKVQFAVPINESFVIDLTNEDKLSADVLTTSKDFSVNPFSYYVNYTKPTCNAIKLDTVQFKIIEYNGVQWYVNSDRKLAFKYSGTTKVCNDTAIQTQYSNIVLFNSTNNLLQSLKGMEVDLDEEERISSDYLRFDASLNLAQITKRICLEIRANAQILPSPFHPDSYLRLRNDIISEIICKKVLVHAVIGENRRHFCTDSLPVYYQNEQRELQSNTKLLMNQISNTTVAKIPCAEATLPIFASVDRKIMLMASPIIKLFNVTLSHVNNSLHDENLNEQTGHDLLFSHAQINEWRAYMSYRTIHQSLLHVLVNTVCQNENCGHFVPAENESSFPLHLLNPIGTLAGWLRYELFHLLTTIGSLISLVIGLIYAISWTLKLVQLCTLRSQNVPYSEAIKHIFIPVYPKVSDLPQNSTESPIEKLENTQPLVPYVHRVYR